MSGWVKFHRKIEEWEWYNDANTFRVFFHLVMKANHKDGKWQGVDVKRGEFITSPDKLAESLKLTRQQIRTSLNKLKSTNEITIKTTNKYSVVTIENYGLYQTCDEEVTIKTTTKSTNEQQTNNQQITTNKNDKNDKNEKNKDIEDVWSSYPCKKGKAEALKKIPKILDKYSKDELLRSIKRYDESVKDKQYLKHGSTFFNGCYEDYLDEVYKTNQQPKPEHINPNDMGELLRRMK